MAFPDTKYMGSKQAILPFIGQELANVDCDTVLDAFSGSACVSYRLKVARKRVISNDFLQFAYRLSKATIENNRVRLDQADVERIAARNQHALTFIRDTYCDLYFDEQDCVFLDNAYANIAEIECDMKRSLALAALCRACMKKRPRGIFSFVGHKGWDGRRDLKMRMEVQFVHAVRVLNAAVFDNGRENLATCLDVFETSTKGVDLVYIDTPYISPHSDSDYTRRYHFVEGLCTYWQGVVIQPETVTKKIKSRPTAFKSAATAEDAFLRLFHHFRDCKLAISYSSNGVPSRERMFELLREFKSNIRVAETNHKYSHGNHRHKVGDNNNEVTEYLFVAT